VKRDFESLALAGLLVALLLAAALVLLVGPLATAALMLLVGPLATATLLLTGLRIALALLTRLLVGIVRIHPSSPSRDGPAPASQ
jgi:hypothetical protein